MSEPCADPVEKRPNLRTVRAAEVAGAQWGVIGARQLRACGVSSRSVARWQESGKLHERLPGVYSFGHRFAPIEGELVAALLYAGSGAVLSHRTAAWWWRLIDGSLGPIELSRGTGGRSLPAVVIHRARHLDSTRHRRFPITTVAQTLVDFAADARLNEVRRALAQAEFLGILDVVAVEGALGRGRRGSAKLRKALERHQPRLAYTRSRTERTLITLCEQHGVELPEVNVKLHGWRVDFFWRRHGLVVETDGRGNHHTAAQIDRDHRMDLTLRNAGRTVNRYSRRQVEEDGAIVIADIARTLAALEAAMPSARSGTSGPGP